MHECNYHEWNQLFGKSGRPMFKKDEVEGHFWFSQYRRYPIFYCKQCLKIKCLKIAMGV